MLKKIFCFHQNLIQKNQNQNLKKAWQRGKNLKKERLLKLKKKRKNINNELVKKYFTDYERPSELHKTESKKNEDQVYLIKNVLNKMKKKNLEKVPEDKKSMIEENEKITNIVEHILYFNQLEQKGEGLKILTPNQMLSRLPISLAQLKAGNNSEKL